MKAIIVENPGPEGRLIVAERPDPIPAAGEVLIRVEAAAVNSADRHLVSGGIARMLGSQRQAATIPGIDGSGVIEGVGSGISRERIGERVVINGAITCDSCLYCAAGDNGMCINRRALGQLIEGTYAELVAVPAANALPIADSLSFEEAAAIPAVTLTAWQALVRRAGLRKGESVLVSAAASGVGSAAIQVAKHLGARVVALASTHEKLKHALRCGADLGVLASPRLDRDLAAALGDGADVVLDVPGPTMWQAWIRTSALSGRIVTCTSDWSSAANLAGFGPKQLSLLATGPFGSKKDAVEILGLANRGVIGGFVSDVLPLEDAAAAHARLDARAVAGKIILKP